MKKKRNITLNELDGIIGVIKKNNKQEKIVIISDTTGYKYLKENKIFKKI